MKRFVIKTMGCKVNQCESEAIRNAFTESDPSISWSSTEGADVVIVNTCTVTRKAAMQSRQAVRQAIRTNPGARIVVTGCHAQTAPEELSGIDGVDLVVGNRDKHLIPHQILSGKSLAPESVTQKFCPDISRAKRFEALPAISHGNRTRPFLKIQDGCDAFCTYCIVPHARGRSRSLPLAQVMDQITQLGRLGYHEVVLTGIHLGCYGQDLIPAIGLYDLLCRIRDGGAIHRVRISSIEPGELSDEIIDLATTAKETPGRLCPHFHLPLQSGDDTILKRMHRPYHRETFRDLVCNIIGRLPDAAIGVDTLIGFPGETESAFENTYSLIQDLPVAYLHVFPFSAREGTPAFSFSEQIHPSVIKQRCENMRRLGADKRSIFYGRSLGKTVTVLVETTRNNIDGRLRGLTDNYLPVRFHGPDHFYNTFQQIDVHRLLNDGVPGGAQLETSPTTSSQYSPPYRCIRLNTTILP